MARSRRVADQHGPTAGPSGGGVRRGARQFRWHLKIVSGLFCLAAMALATAPESAYAFTQPNTHASCAGSVSAGLSTGAMPGLDRQQFERIIQSHAARQAVPPGEIVSRHAKEHGD